MWPYFLFLDLSFYERCSDCVSVFLFACTEDDSDEEDLPLNVEKGNSLSSVKC